MNRDRDMKTVKKVLIVYFSGAGSAKKTAECMLASLSQECKAELFSIENNTAFNMNEYDALIIGTPVYHGAPSRVVTDYFDTLPPLITPLPAFIYNTRSLWSGNTNRILAKQIKKKHIITIMDKAYRSPASDGSLLVPFVQRFFEFQSHLQEKIASDCAEFTQLLQKETLRGYVPRFRLGSILNAPNKLAGQLITITIHLHRGRCVKCGKCIDHCPHKALEKDYASYPVFLKKNCENCYRCIHHCPQMALSLSKRRTAKKVLQFQSL